MDFDVETDGTTLIANFYRSKTKHKHLALLTTSLAHCLHYIACLWFFNFSIIYPFHSIFVNLGIVFNQGWTLLMLLFLQVVIAIAVGYLLINHVFSAAYEPILNLAKRENFVAFVAFAVANFFALCSFSFILHDVPVWMNSSSMCFFTIIAILMASFVSAHSSNFAWDVDEAYAMPHLVKTGRIWHATILPDLTEKLRIVVKVMVCTWFTAFMIGLFFESIRLSIWGMFAFWRFADIFVFIFTQQLMVDVGLLIYNYFIAYPIFYSMPPYNLYSASLRDSKSILAALSCKTEPLIIENALFSLRNLASSESGRESFYALSSPGFHPRGWKHLLQIVVHFVNKTRTQLEAATVHSKTIQQQQQNAKLVNLSANISRSAASKIQLSVNGSRIDSLMNGSQNDSSLNDSFALSSTQGQALVKKSATQQPTYNCLFDEKQCFFLPPSLNPRSHEYFGQSKQVFSLLNSFFFPSLVTAVLSRTKATLLTPPPLLSTFDTKCVIFAIQAISSVVARSLNEDRYGVVQKDLKMVLTLLTGLSSTIDAYVRTSKLGRNDRYDSNVFILDGALANSLRDIYAVFQPVISELNLPTNELEIFETLTH